MAHRAAAEIQKRLASGRSRASSGHAVKHHPSGPPPAPAATYPATSAVGDNDCRPGAESASSGHEQATNDDATDVART